MNGVGDGYNLGGRAELPLPYTGNEQEGRINLGGRVDLPLPHTAATTEKQQQPTHTTHARKNQHVNGVVEGYNLGGRAELPLPYTGNEQEGRINLGGRVDLPLPHKAVNTEKQRPQAHTHTRKHKQTTIQHI
jgi:hypothetical protein